jgi:DNA-binding CsgD family transcriptional regulator
MPGMTSSESDGGPDAAIPFSIWPVGTSRVTGSGVITPGPGNDYSTIHAQWEGLQPTTDYALSQHHGENCGEMEHPPEFIFPTLRSDSQGKASAVLTPRKPFWRWWNRPHFLVLHWGPASAFDPMACGEIAPPPEGRPASAPPVQPFILAVQPGLRTGAPAPGRAVATDALTPRELEVLILVAMGCTNGAIASKLVLSERTVERHVGNIYAKLGVGGRVEATSWAIRHEVIRLD